ncbi:MAG: acylphosphatase [Desulfobacula sp.]|nr:acylphosphatase [Desulfobacula sp.]
MQNNLTIKAIISGRVQGVFYRVETKKAADLFNVKGYVRNLPDGCVEAVFQADKETLEKMAQWCYQGSPGSAVNDVDIQTDLVSQAFISFDIRY